MTSTFGPEGITLDRHSDTLADLIANAKIQWGDSVNTDKDEILGHQIIQQSLITATTNEIVQAIYDALSVQNSSGTLLSGLVALVGVNKQGFTYSIVVLSITAIAPTTVLTGTQYATASGLVFATDIDLVFSTPGTLTVAATCTVEGPNNAEIGEVNVIKNAVYGVTTVTNLAAVIPGKDEDTDPELKAKHSNAVATSGLDDISSIYEALYNVEGVSAVYAFDNDTSAAIGVVPAGYIYLVVIGGLAADIAAAIDDNKTGGVPTHGSETESVYNKTTRQLKDIHYDIGAEVPIHIEINITKPATFPIDGETTIKNNYVALYASSYLKKQVIYEELIGPAYSIPGVILNSLKVDTVDPPTGMVDILMTALQKPTLVFADIDIVVTPA